MKGLFAVGGNLLLIAIYSRDPIVLMHAVIAAACAWFGGVHWLVQRSKAAAQKTTEG